MAEIYINADSPVGNDWPGTTFTDAVFASAGNTLTKAGAFTAANAKVGASLYLTDNGSGEVTAGYYSIVSRDSDNQITHSADIRSGANEPTDVKCTLHDGTTSLPWKTVQFALNKTTQGATGDTFWLHGDDVLAAKLSFTAYGTPAYNKPCIFRGWDGTTAVTDGAGSIDGNAGNFKICDQGAGVGFYHLTLKNTGTADVVTGVLSNYGSFCVDCEVTNSSADGIDAFGYVAGCYVHDIDGVGIYANVAFQNYLIDGTKKFNIAIKANNNSGVSSILENFITLNSGAAAQIGIEGYASAHIARNSIISSNTQANSYGISNAGWTGLVISENLIEGFSGATSFAIYFPTNSTAVMFGNKYFACTDTDDPALAATILISATELLGASPFEKTDSNTFANRFAYFRPKSTLVDGGWPTGCNRDPGACERVGTASGLGLTAANLRTNVVVDDVTGSLVVPGEASNGGVLAQTTGANARGGSGTCAKFYTASTSVYGYWDFYVPVTAAEFKLSFYYKSYHTTTAWNGLLKVSMWDSDNPTEDPPPLLASVDVAGTYDATYRLWESAAKTAAAAGLCRVRIEIKDGADSGGVYIDDLAVTAT